MIEELSVGLTFLSTFPEVLFLPEIVFAGRLLILICGETVQVGRKMLLIPVPAVSCIISLAVIMTYYFRMFEKSRWRVWDMVIQWVMALLYLVAFVLQLTVPSLTKESGSITNENDMYSETLCGYLMLLHTSHAVFATIRWVICRKSDVWVECKRGKVKIIRIKEDTCEYSGPRIKYSCSDPSGER